MFGVSQPTICRIWRRITEVLETVLVFTSGGVEEAVTIWGSSCWSTAPTFRPGTGQQAGRALQIYSGKRKVQCVNHAGRGHLPGRPRGGVRAVPRGSS